ncbi:barstar family protein [Tenacibaculum sp. AHE15PA]|uniref:barstar family protein n=1 Tax=unclassified Tenacibaculum TaxID=2635139 RepID=UPI001C4F4620|nr:MULTISPECIES: barstar family protein [unclassified Tenacibaculum]QXP74717.1 barstar family protein [Tenacibaculum sp. AHE14PA]QXP76228.1 barstar family protein [Tenacibaculum sp. AHE15PA]
MKHIKINSSKISDWDSFHNVFSEIFNFPDYYGRNINAWIDCMDELTTELTLIDFGDCRELKNKQPEIINSINECSAFVNFRRIEAEEEPVLIISMFS